MQFPGTDAAGTEINDAEASARAEVLTEVKDAGFTNADLTDSWVRPGDLSPARLAEFKQTATNVGIGIPVISAIRRSVIEEGNGEANLANGSATASTRPLPPPPRWTPSAPMSPTTRRQSDHDRINHHRGRP